MFLTIFRLFSDEKLTGILFGFTFYLIKIL